MLIKALSINSQRLQTTQKCLSAVNRYTNCGTSWCNTEHYSALKAMLLT